MLAVDATKTAPDTWAFTVTGVSAASFRVELGDSSAPLTVDTDPSGTTVVEHRYTTPGHHDYVVTFTAVITAWAATLQQITDRVATLDEIAAAIATLGEVPRDRDVVTVAVTVDVGPATIAATVVPANPVPFVQVDVWIGNPATVRSWTVSRDGAGQLVTIRVGGASFGAESFEDHTAPLAVPVTYRLTVTYSDGTAVSVTSAAVILAGTAGCFLTDPHTGATAAVTLVSWPTRERAARRSVLDVLARPDPIALSDVHTWAAGTWTLLTRTDNELAALLDILTASAVVLLRTQPGASITDVTASVGTIGETRYSGRGDDPRRLLAVDIQEIGPIPATALPLNATLADLADLAPGTLNDLDEIRPTLLQLSRIRF